MPPSAPARLVPVWRDLLCDGLTPVEAYARLRTWERGGGPLANITYMLESVGAGGERWARYSVVGVGCRARVTGVWDGDDVELTVTAAPGFTLPAGMPTRSRGLGIIAELLAHYRCSRVPDLPRFWGGLCGVWGHDMVRVFEDIRPTPGVTVRRSELPALDLVVTDTLVVFDNFSQRVRIVACACPRTDGGPVDAIDAAYARIDAVAAALDTAAVLRPQHLPSLPPPMRHQPALWSRDDFLAAVQRAREYISAGDIFQVVLSQLFLIPRPRTGPLDALEMYRMLRATNPAPYMYCFELPSAGLIGASPEVLVRCDLQPSGGLRVTLRPIAGTRPRGPNDVEDDALATELLADPKERAEHLMLVDLGRNDLGRVCVPGSVRVSESFAIERYSRVMHIVSEITGDLRPELSALDALRATFPAGTLSGAPKIRALQILDELEPVARGWYGGAVGYLGFDGAADFAICIRSLVRAHNYVRVQAGAGIVHDSIPAAEDRECHAKASAGIHAVELATAVFGPPAQPPFPIVIDPETTP